VANDEARYIDKREKPLFVPSIEILAQIQLFKRKKKASLMNNFSDFSNIRLN
jgi:hypothetical protein